MNRFLKGTLLLLLGVAMLAWFGYSIVDPPTRPSETYTLDWVMVFVRLVGAIAAFIGAIMAFIGK